ncbi:hypothetical protein GPJ56_009214 [Histomonas meleagridis]|uniref:uncharacterized protein n=1 Tax=Histomonas meleagridis TaxID=135588 RepID=UPI00355A857A|nr:hypothetical protein GPJ56_009214 [Histomonas meleagridis]KAH0801587.1 hypothetical protein GO595_005586 [Histomonas meleagridis]
MTQSNYIGSTFGPFQVSKGVIQGCLPFELLPTIPISTPTQNPTYATSTSTSTSTRVPTNRPRTPTKEVVTVIGHTPDFSDSNQNQEGNSETGGIIAGVVVAVVVVAAGLTAFFVWRRRKIIKNVFDDDNALGYDQNNNENGEKNGDEEQKIEHNDEDVMNDENEMEDLFV